VRTIYGASEAVKRYRRLRRLTARLSNARGRVRLTHPLVQASIAIALLHLGHVLAMTAQRLEPIAGGSRPPACP
jgi:hypothetical protein